MSMMDKIADCCRACLKIDCKLTSIRIQDTDSIKFLDKLLVCVAEVSWLKEGLPSLICETCIDRLRVAYDFRVICLQSDYTLSRYLNLSEEKYRMSYASKYPCTVTPPNENLSMINTDEQNIGYIHLKHFLDSEEEQMKNDRLLKSISSCNITNESTPLSVATNKIADKRKIQWRHNFHRTKHTEGKPDLIPENNRKKCNSHVPCILAKNQHQQHQEGCQKQTNVQQLQEFLYSPQIHQHHSVQEIIQQVPETYKSRVNEEAPAEVSHTTKNNQNGAIQTMQIVRRVIKRTTGIQVRPLTPANLSFGNPNSITRPYTCRECGKNYRKNANLRIHMRTHTGEKPFECKYCEKRFHHSSHLREHIRRHTGEKPFHCAVCNKRFTIRGELTMHMKSHTGEKPYSCTCCERRCLTAADLKVHMRTHTGEKPFKCNMCIKTFASAYILNSHIKTHTGERPYSCTKCEKTFTQSSHLNVHNRKHTGEKVGCRICNVKFSHSSQLTVHMREHTGKQPYKCTVCNKICNYASELQSHMMKHSGEKFTCVTCDKKFTTSAYLHEHNRTHTGENLSTCTICDRQFTRHQYLEKHMRTHTGEKPFTCFICDKKFTQSSSLKAHSSVNNANSDIELQTNFVIKMKMKIMTLMMEMRISNAAWSLINKIERSQLIKKLITESSEQIQTQEEDEAEEKEEQKIENLSSNKGKRIARSLPNLDIASTYCRNFFPPKNKGKDEIDKIN
ncbi:uncharacterized protein isoform X2 [Leptinotarsa decemlineata]|uniref:uncharacterized protein isoform X2 n=1 Tax=Leptinotarsa decemlineata TaxID=7539 RepID=UPI003D309E25